jgi:hypothetical protein
MAKTRAIRFSDLEEKQIQEFLKQNPFFDFSNLARAAILKFIQEPSLNLKAIKGPKQPLNERGLR